MSGLDRLIDLHTHTNFSDGTMKPAELVRYAKKRGLAAIAITDHDTVNGVGEALEEGDNLGLEVVPGVEIDVVYDGELHILGYYIDIGSRRIKDKLEDMNSRRNKRNVRLVRKLNGMGVDITLEEAMNEAQGDIVGRLHIAKALVRKGVVQSIPEAFDRFIGIGKPGYIEKEKLTPKQGIELIKSAGGIAVLAHPLLIGLSMEKLDKLLAELKGYGLGGIEAYYTSHTYEDMGNLLRLAVKHGLAATGGTDFHGANKPEVEIGTGRGNLRIGYELLQGLKNIRGKEF